MERHTQTENEGNRRAAEDPDAIQEDIHRTRERIDETLDAIKQQLSPGDLFSQLMSYFTRQNGGTTNVGSKSSDMLSSVAHTVREHPIPVALIGIGLLGLARDGGERRLGDGKAKLARVGEPAGEVGEKVQEKVQDVAAETREALERGYEKVRQRIEDDPIVLGALGIALGAALGAGLPRTQIEDRMLGEKRDELAAKAKHVGEQIREGVRHVADEIAQA